MRKAAAAVLLAALLLAGCDRWRVDTVTLTTVNDSGERLSNVEVQFDGGSFGIASLAPGEKNTRVIRFLGESQLSYSYRDAQDKKHEFKEGAFRRGSQGTATVHIGPGGQVKFEREFGKER